MWNEVHIVHNCSKFDVSFGLELERQERRELETRALGLIRDAKRKWENAEKDKIAQLNQHIAAQTIKITSLCTSNNEISSQLQKAECDLQTANAELDKLRIFQVSNIIIYNIM